MAEYQLEYCQFPHCRESANGPVKAEPGPDHAALCPSRQAASIPLPSVTAQAGRLRYPRGTAELLARKRAER